MTFTTQLIQGLWKIRNREEGDPFRVRPWLRQTIRLERERRNRKGQS